LRADLNAFKDETRGELLDIRGELRQVNERLDKLPGQEMRDLAARVARLEEHTGLKPAAE
jgi:hypothetical protein